MQSSYETLLYTQCHKTQQQMKMLSEFTDNDVFPYQMFLMSPFYSKSPLAIVLQPFSFNVSKDLLDASIVLIKSVNELSSPTLAPSDVSASLLFSFLGTFSYTSQGSLLGLLLLHV